MSLEKTDIQLNNLIKLMSASSDADIKKEKKFHSEHTEWINKLGLGKFIEPPKTNYILFGETRGGKTTLVKYWIDVLNHRGIKNVFIHEPSILRQFDTWNGLDSVLDTIGGKEYVFVDEAWDDTSWSINRSKRLECYLIFLSELMINRKRKIIVTTNSSDYATLFVNTDNKIVGRLDDLFERKKLPNGEIELLGQYIEGRIYV